MRCTSFCIAENYKLQAIANYFKNKNYVVKSFRKVLYISHPTKRNDIFIFHYGCVVFWGLKCDEEQQIIEQIKSFAVDPLLHIESDRFIYHYGERTEMVTHDRFNVDIIILESDNIQLKLAISYGLAQSVQLEFYETEVQKTIDQNAHFPQQLAQRGTIKLSQKNISKRMGEIFMARSLINLGSDYLEDPEYFWEHPSLESYYTMSKKFLDIPRRVSALNQKLNVLYELFEMLTSQLQHQHSNLLEVIIIVLILTEIAISLFTLKW